ncbi:MAG TPA: hypothetical protein VLN56_10660 [Gammaproteobacteria bacterium]|nr:hypothetical protein [Gammaproteobacteria bacterium]
MSITINREMTITHADFFRILPKALRNCDYTVSSDEVQVKTGTDGRVIILLSEEKRRRIGSISLPVTGVELRFEGMSEQSTRKFLAGFDRAYQKGGG